MNAKAALLLLAVMAYGCSTTMTIPDTAPGTVEVTWVRVAEAEIAFWCEKAQTYPGQKLIACAALSGTKCTIYTAKGVSLEVIGHELAHCYLGAWHR